jgi:indole-3-glycerol phosphate synthase
VNTLDKIFEYKKLELEHRRRKVSEKDLQKKAEDTEAARGFLSGFDDGINIIAEVKKASPSAGIIREDFNPVDIAQIYADHGAKALSVLTDEHFFQGHLDYLEQIKAQVKLPALRKDFTLAEYHLFEARAHGADAILLIAAMLDPYQLKDYHDLACELGMTPLVEIHAKEELEPALALDLKLLGINNRNLKTFKVDIQTSLQLVENLEISAPIIAESGLKDRHTLVKLHQAGINGFLIGESLMRADDIGAKLQSFLKDS